MASASRDSSTLRFEDVLPHLVTFFRQGILAPFIGSGLSFPTCTSWRVLLQRLAEESEVSPPLDLARTEIPAATLYRLADLTVSALRPLSHEARLTRYRNALRGWGAEERAAVPPQTQALARLSWPLVLTTNYDDLFWNATHLRDRPEIVGRHLEDCHRVLRSLDDNSPPLLWTLQGFIGGQLAKAEDVVRDANRRVELANQVVLGHQQYQRVVNAEPHFRRAFAEVFRRKSFLFLGSGLLEDYLVNLFGEIIHHHGLGPHPHFALLSCQERERFDPWFLQTRLGVVPVFYDDHCDLPIHLSQLATAVSPGFMGREQVTARIDEVTYEFSQKEADVFPRLKVVVCNSEVPYPTPEVKGCSVVSVGRRSNVPLQGKMARQLVQKAGLGDSVVGWIPMDEAPSYVFRYGDSSLFAVAARQRDLSEGHDLRDLGIIPEALCAALERLDTLRFEAAHLGALASGKDAPWHPIHPFAQMLRGVRRFAMSKRKGNLQSINVHIVDPAVWRSFLAHRIAVLELLSSDLVTYRIEVRDEDGGVESFAVTLRESPLLSELLDFCKIDRRRWIVKILPSATGEETREPPGDTVIVPTMKVLLLPRG